MRSEYRSLIIAWDEARSSAESANSIFDAVHALYKTLRQSEAGRAAISSLITDPRPAVRLTAATHSLAWDPVASEEALIELADTEGAHSLAAKWTLKSFRRGTLDLDW